MPQRFIPRLIELYRAGRFPFDPLVKLYDFADINRAMDDARRGETVKPALRIGGSRPGGRLRRQGARRRQGRLTAPCAPFA